MQTPSFHVDKPYQEPKKEAMNQVYEYIAAVILPRLLSACSEQQKKEK